MRQRDPGHVQQRALNVDYGCGPTRASLKLLDLLAEDREVVALPLAGHHGW